MAVRDAFFPGKLALVAQNIGLSTWTGFAGNLPDPTPSLYASSDRVLIPLLCSFNIICFFIKLCLSNCTMY